MKQTKQIRTNIFTILEDDDYDMEGIIDDETTTNIEKLHASNIYGARNQGLGLGLGLDLDLDHDYPSLDAQVNFDLGEQEIMLPIKKKKGRKSKKDKQLELEAIERNKVPPKLFPNLNEKIFDVIEIKGIEYFLDPYFGIIYDGDTNQVGIKKKDEYVFYTDFAVIDKIVSQLKLDDGKVEQIIKSCTK